MARESLRVLKAEHAGGTAALVGAAGPSLMGAVLAFLAGLLALKWLSGWLENGRWYFFGIYCLIAAAVVGALYYAGF